MGIEAINTYSLMSWVKYLKDAQKHPACKSVKRQLTVLAKKYGGHVEFFIKLNGTAEHDKQRLRFYERWIYQDLVRDIQKSMKENDEHGYDGYYTTNHQHKINFIKDLSIVCSYINNNYYIHEIYPESKRPVHQTMQSRSPQDQPNE